MPQLRLKTIFYDMCICVKLFLSIRNWYVLSSISMRKYFIPGTGMEDD